MTTSNVTISSCKPPLNYEKKTKQCKTTTKQMGFLCKFEGKSLLSITMDTFTKYSYLEIAKRDVYPNKTIGVTSYVRILVRRGWGREGRGGRGMPYIVATLYMCRIFKTVLANKRWIRHMQVDVEHFATCVNGFLCLSVSGQSCLLKMCYGDETKMWNIPLYTYIFVIQFTNFII